MIGRILVLAALAVVLPIAVLFVLGMKILEDEMGRQLDTLSSTAGGQLSGILADDAARLQRDGARAADDERLSFAVSSQLKGSVGEVARALRRTAGSDYVLIVDARGEPLATDGEIVFHAADLRRWEEGVGYVLRGGEVHLIGSWPVASLDPELETAGRLFAGRRLDGERMVELARRSGAEAMVFHESDLAIASFDPADDELVLPEHVRISFEEPREEGPAPTHLLSIGGTRHSVSGSRLPRAHPDDPPLYAAAAVSRRYIGQAGDRFATVTLLTAAIGVAMAAIVAGAGYQHLLVRPALSLKAALAGLVEGRDDVHTMPIDADFTPLAGEFERTTAALSSWRADAGRAAVVERLLSAVRPDSSPEVLAAFVQALAGSASAGRRGRREFDLNEAVERALALVGFELGDLPVRKEYEGVLLVREGERPIELALVQILLGTIPVASRPDGVSIASRREGDQARLEIAVAGVRTLPPYDRAVIEAAIAMAGGRLELVSAPEGRVAFVVHLAVANGESGRGG